MKENEAPKKIYLNKHPFTGELHDKWLRNKWDDSDIEYTRTDAFIEKACKWLRENKNRYVYNKGGHGDYIPTCSNQIIEDFKKYMKGEKV